LGNEGKDILDPKTLITLEGTIDRITFRNEENHFTIARMKIKGQREAVPVIGYLFSVNPGEVLRINGYYEMHAKYGLQLRIESYQSLLPATVQGIERYLGSGLVKGIGPETAKRIVKKFGLKTLDIIEKDIRRLSEVEGVGPKRIVQIKAAWKEQKAIRHLMIFLQGYGVSTGLATKIFKTYGQQAIARIKENPYGLADDIFGVGFLTADRMAQKMGMEKEAPVRLRAGITFVLRQKSDEGQVCLPELMLIQSAGTQLEVETDRIQEMLESRMGKGGGLFFYLIWIIMRK
jgi:exodeoxyribonuclease V alpha subunit